MGRQSFISSLFVLALLPAAARASELVILVDTATEMPMARFERYRLVDGIHRDIGVALARHMQRTPRFVTMPRKRVARALANGHADVLCSYVPEWLNGSFHWTRPFIPIVEVLVADRSVARPRSIAELAGKPIGTVLGYEHPELEAILGSGFVRADGPTTEGNLRKVAAGRVKYAVTGKTFLDWRLKQGDMPLTLHPPLVVKSYMGQCAVSPKGRATVAEVDRAIGAMIGDGTINAIVAKYR
ncbi:ABC transporter substrate-binding protein [Massilia sp. PAMC28688]|uniref:substrate-binding periplasmic protein n=1 Tax=Massilia sp. PAMC28688 TaxID=2861283 RepID=UPI001C6330C8|nr:transporter substrate-binding domain-containing protein [Massilia sp. PAMC28688]QYF93918.1 ABC transporter substrate-binding protein [Massilia sp. PAMC28688]